MLPLWADVLIILAIPAIFLGAVWIWGDDPPDNTVEHHQENAERDGEDPDLMAAAA